MAASKLFEGVASPKRCTNALSYLLGPGMAITIFCFAFSNINLSMVSVSEEKRCLQAVGYCTTLSCVVANLSIFGFVYLCVFLTLWVVCNGSMIPRMDLSDWDAVGDDVDPGIMSSKHFFIFTVLVRVGLSLMLFTAVSPSFMPGNPHNVMVS
jgi:hypothetical protein